jgi:prepilin-type N-terminal cleavage/methylation domain-containing protein
MKIRQHPPASAIHGFTLLEVTIASAVLAVALFAILTLCSTNMRTARALGRVHVDASSLAAQLSLTNRLEIGEDNGNFGDMHPGYTWSRRITEYKVNDAESTGLFLVEFEVSGDSGGRVDQSRMQLMLYRPDSVRRAGR